MKYSVILLLITISVLSVAQVPITEIEGRLAVYLPEDSTSVHIGKNAGADQQLSNMRKNTFVGTNAGRYNGSNRDNTFMGNDAGTYSSGSRNSFFGIKAGNTNDGKQNSFFGDSAGRESIGQANAFYGDISGENNEGNNNAFFGAESGTGNKGSYNSFLGFETGLINQGDYNCFFGNEAGLDNQTGNFNNYIGHRAGQKNEVGNRNIAIGSSSLRNAKQKSDNIAIGDSTMYGIGITNESNSFGQRNVAIGTRAFYGTDSEIGRHSVAIGYEAGMDGGQRSVYIGYQAGKDIDQLDDKLYINNSSGDSPLLYGEFNNQLLRVNGAFQVTESIGLGTETPEAKMHIAGTSTEARLLFDNAGDIMWKTSTGSARPILTLHSDDNTYLDGEKDIIFRTKSNFQKRMRIDEDGNVGIGIDNPNATLHIKDFAKLEPQTIAPDCANAVHEGRVYYDKSSGEHKLKVCVEQNFGTLVYNWIDLH